jgi:hypothetical protein
MLRKTAEILGFSLLGLSLMVPSAYAATKEEKLAKAEQTAALAPEMMTLFQDQTFPYEQEADQTIKIEYVVFFGGFHLATLQFSGSITDNVYKIRSAIQTEGVADALAKTTADIGSQGVVDQKYVRPTLYNSDVTDANQRQLVSMVYEDFIAEQASSFPEYNLERFPVADEMKVDTVDPISAIMFILQGSAVTSDNACGGTIPIFDGRRRFNISLEHVDTEEVSTGKNGAFKGEAYKCWVGYKKIAGFKLPKTKRAQKKWEKAKSDWPDIHMWINERDDGLRVPVRIQSETTFGVFVARASVIEVKSRTELAAGGPLTPPFDMETQ